jgi:hypothetical protein
VRAIGARGTVAPWSAQLKESTPFGIRTTSRGATMRPMQILLGLLALGPLQDGVTACADCHASIAESWSRTSMARALSPLEPGELAGLAQVAEAGTGFSYAFEQDERGARVVETHERAPAQRNWATLAFTIGAGEVDRSYAALKGGMLWFAPLERLHGRAALAPFLSMRPGARFSLPITPECLACHTEALPPRAWPMQLAPAADVWRPRGIGCGACHAHGAEHGAWRADELAGARPSQEDPLRAPASLARIQQVSVCAACHLQGDARIELDPGRLAIPEPGGDLLERRAVFVAAQPTDEIGFVSQVERLVLSRCYTADARMTCTTCHDPHTAGDEPRLRAACERCHASEDCHSRDAAARAQRDCVDCHMRKSLVFDVSEVEIHDHWIRTHPGPASPPPERLRFAESPDGRWTVFAWPDAPRPAYADDPGLWVMALAHGGLRTEALARCDQAVGERVQRLPMYHHVHGSLLEEAGRWEEAERAYRQALTLDRELAESTTNLALVLGRLGRAREGLALLGALVAEHPRAQSALVNRALLKRELGDRAGFEADLEQAQRVLPRAELALELAALCESDGRAAQAARWRAEARRLDPGR